MADSNYQPVPGHAGGSVAPSPSIGPLSEHSYGDAGSHQEPLLRYTADGNLARNPGNSVPDAPLLHQEVPAENPTNATNRELVSFEPKFINREVIEKQPNLARFDDLKFWPTVLQVKAVISLVLLYAVTAIAIGVLMWRSIENPNHNFHLSSENVHMISRYFPSVVGTATVLLFRQTVREALRMVPYVSMADQKDGVRIGSEPWKGVGGEWFPWQSITTTPKSFMSVFSLMCQFMASFIVSFKVALFASTEHVDDDTNENYWVLTVRLYPAAVLILGYIMMIVYTLYVSFHFSGKSTGLKWDPVSIADYASLFAQCNALPYFAPLELQHDLRPKHVMVPDRLFRLGYWTRVRGDPQERDVVYGIGVGLSARTDSGHSKKERVPLGRPWQQVATFRKVKPPPIPVDDCNRPGACAHSEHYPYIHNPGCARWAIVLASVIPIVALALSIYALVIRLPYNGFTLPNNLKLPSDFYWGVGNSTHELPPIDPTDPKSTVLLWALIFRSAPTYVAGLFTSTIVTWIDLNMRFMQPFRNMYGEGPKKTIWQRCREWLGWRHGTNNEPSDEKRTPAKTAESILLAYITVSPFQVPLTAWDKGHYKVCIYSTLNTLSPLFPIFVGGLLTVTPDEKYDKVNFSFSLSAYIGIMVSLVLYSILLPAAIPGTYRLLPRQLYSLADLMAMCHESRFMASPHLDITDPSRTPTKEHMEARILLTDDRFLFGEYRGRDGRRHIGFDVAQEREPDFGKLKDIGGSVRHISPVSFASKVQRTMTTVLEEGIRAGRAMTGAMTSHGRSPFAQKAHDIRPGDEYEMSGALVQPSATAETSGSQPQQAGNRGRILNTPSEESTTSHD
ncbi:hypothetical protein AOQ84DRAFT_386557 [Glonium stellatum]|uniref:Uncharacterized protein n=1 Tax=Glonium stellatum TaxID=574774 RepID=A0A8E2F7M3_9PEZI|nr:hypothetical protein AOQ84DRAFT_386557 [Glonium stellatum]